MINKFAIVVAVFAILLIVAGATVTSTDSGDAIPDWPFAYGSLIPPLIGGVRYEYAHRVIAGVTAILVLTLTILCWATKQRGSICWTATIAFIAIILQAILGGLRVLIVSNENVRNAIFDVVGKMSSSNLRILFTIAHAILAQTVLSLTFVIATLTSNKWQNDESLYKIPIYLKLSVILFLITLFLQILLGAIIRHKGIGLIISDFPLSFGKLIPDFNNLPHNPDAPFPTTYEKFKTNVILAFTHRWLALGIVIFILALLIYIKRYCKNNTKLINLSFVIIGHIVVQIIIGMLIVWFQAPTIITVLHTAIGASILGMTVNFVLWTFKST